MNGSAGGARTPNPASAGLTAGCAGEPCEGSADALRLDLRFASDRPCAGWVLLLPDQDPGAAASFRCLGCGVGGVVVLRDATVEVRGLPTVECTSAGGAQDIDPKGHGKELAPQEGLEPPIPPRRD